MILFNMYFSELISQMLEYSLFLVYFLPKPQTNPCLMCHKHVCVYKCNFFCKDVRFLASILYC